MYLVTAPIVKLWNECCSSCCQFSVSEEAETELVIDERGENNNNDNDSLEDSGVQSIVEGSDTVLKTIEDKAPTTEEPLLDQVCGRVARVDGHYEEAAIPDTIRVKQPPDRGSWIGMFKHHRVTLFIVLVPAIVRLLQSNSVMQQLAEIPILTDFIGGKEGSFGGRILVGSTIVCFLTLMLIRFESKEVVEQQEFLTGVDSSSFTSDDSVLLPLMEFKVSASDDDYFEESGDNHWNRVADLSFFHKHCVSPFREGLNALNAKRWNADGSLRQSALSRVEQMDIQLIESREQFWLPLIDKIQSELLRAAVRLVFSDFIGKSSINTLTDNELKSKRRAASLLFDRIQRIWSASESSPLPPPESWQSRPVFVRFVLSDSEAAKWMRSLLAEKSRDLLSESRWHQEIVDGRRHSKDGLVVPLMFVDSLPMLRPLELNVNCDNLTGKVRGAVRSFETGLFKGKLLVRLVGLPSSKGTGYFYKRQRKMQVVIQGKFKQRLPMDCVFTGELFAVSKGVNCQSALL